MPAALTYSNVTASITGQNYLLVPTVAPKLASSVLDNTWLIWTGVPGVAYQAYSSTNLIEWEPFGDPVPGTNALMKFAVPVGDQPALFLRLEAVR